MTRIQLKRGRSNPIWHGHPWVYSGAVMKQEGEAEPGAVVDVCDDTGKFIGRGFFNPRSQIRVRMVTLTNEPVDDALVRARILEAVALRRRLSLPSTDTNDTNDTNAFRLFNSEGDGLPGLIVDRYADALAVHFTTLGAKRFEKAIYDALATIEPRAIVEVGGASFGEVEGIDVSPTRVVRGALGEELVRCRENGIELDVDLLHGQKTGMFLDQRDNRKRVQALASGARMLDVYSYAGGFALNALKGGATSATCVDSSARAVERIREHARLNHVELEAVEADAFRFLESCRPESYDLVVLDPPKFARSQKDLPAALKGYRRLNTLGMVACARGGLIVTCSCSQLVSGEDLERVLAQAAKDAGRRCQLLELGSQGADHPVVPGFPEGRYLKFLLCRVL